MNKIVFIPLIMFFVNPLLSYGQKSKEINERRWLKMK